MSSALTKDEIDDLLSDAEDNFPDSDFVASVKEWFLEHGFITEAQEEALNAHADGSAVADTVRRDVGTLP